MSQTFDAEWTSIDDLALDELVAGDSVQTEDVDRPGVEFPPSGATAYDPWAEWDHAASGPGRATMSARRKLVLMLLVTALTIALLILFSNVAGASAAGHCGGG